MDTNYVQNEKEESAPFLIRFTSPFEYDILEFPNIKLDFITSLANQFIRIRFAEREASVVKHQRSIRSHRYRSKKVKLIACFLFIGSMWFTTLPVYSTDLSSEVGVHTDAARAGGQHGKSMMKDQRFVPVPIPISVSRSASVWIGGVSAFDWMISMVRSRISRLFAPCGRRWLIPGCSWGRPIIARKIPRGRNRSSRSFGNGRYSRTKRRSALEGSMRT